MSYGGHKKDKTIAPRSKEEIMDDTVAALRYVGSQMTDSQAREFNDTMLQFLKKNKKGKHVHDHVRAARARKRSIDRTRSRSRSRSVEKEIEKREERDQLRKKVAHLRGTIRGSRK